MKKSNRTAYKYYKIYECYGTEPKNFQLIERKEGPLLAKNITDAASKYYGFNFAETKDAKYYKCTYDHKWNEEKTKAFFVFETIDYVPKKPKVFKGILLIIPIKSEL